MLPINLVLEEALSNVIFYAYEAGSSQEIHIEIEYVAPRLKITIKDTGKAFDPTQKEDPNLHLPVEERPIGGLGIFLMRKIMDEISYERLGKENILRMTKIM
jgi:anti-sigma regulatory factor (Ser/Thr protein kinase)